MSQAYFYNGRYQMINLTSVSDEGISVIISEASPLSLDTLPRLYLVVRYVCGNEDLE